MRRIFDAGALIALERNAVPMWRHFRDSIARDEPPLTHGGVVGQVWRAAGSRQARLAKALDSLDIRKLDAGLGRAAGGLLGRAKRHDVIDAALVLLARDGDQIFTSDPEDIAALVRAAGLDVEIVCT